jgi:PTS system N-acetylglucosamine-specific IIC component
MLSNNKSFSLGKLFSKLGKSLMLPIAVLPIAGILLRIGQPDLLNIAFISQAGGAIFDQLPLLFSFGVAIGFSKDENGAVVLASFVGYIVFIAALKVLDPSLKMGVFGGILIGITTAFLYNKYSNINLPSYIAFFGGKRFVPIATGLAAVLLSVIFYFVWPPIGYVINAIGNWIVGSGNIGLFFYGMLNRLLIPIGLHHILNSLVWFEFGSFTNTVGELVKGDLWRFFALDKSAGGFMSGFFPVMMFGLPAAALAMILNSENKKLAFGVLFSAALTGFLTGVTEPIEFSFMFLAFPLYVIHAILTGLSMVVMNILNIKLGFTFSAGLFDYGLNFGISTNPIILIPVGLVFFAIYFVVFYFGVKFFKIKLFANNETTPASSSSTTATSVGANYLKALGGKDNIIKLDNCTTRLRIDIKNNNLIDENALKNLGAVGVLNNTMGHVQVVIGPKVESVANDIKSYL